MKCFRIFFHIKPDAYEDQSISRFGNAGDRLPETLRLSFNQFKIASLSFHRYFESECLRDLVSAADRLNGRHCSCVRLEGRSLQLLSSVLIQRGPCTLSSVLQNLICLFHSFQAGTPSLSCLFAPDVP